MTTGRRWRFIQGFDRRYLVYSDGTVWSVKARRPMALKQSKSHGYLTVGLWDGTKKVNRTVHSLVAEAFLGPRPPRQEVRHLDDDKFNNAVENLRYGTHSQNMRDALRNGRLGGPPPVHADCSESWCRACHNERRETRRKREPGAFRPVRVMIAV